MNQRNVLQQNNIQFYNNFLFPFKLSSIILSNEYVIYVFKKFKMTDSNYII